MKFTVANVLEIAKQEIGYCEKASSAMLDNKAANAGNGNWTKYGRDLINKIGGPYGNGCAWCDIFADWVFYSACGWDKSKCQNATNGFSAYCPTSAQYYRNANLWYKEPIVGSQFFTGASGHEEHTGIVIEVKSKNIFVTIEGNYGNKVQSITRYTSQCSGFGLPRYDEYYKETEKDTNKVVLPTLKKGDINNSVKTVQRIAYSLYKYIDGKTINVDGEFGPITEKAVMRMQYRNGLSQTGVVDAKTWDAILNKM